MAWLCHDLHCTALWRCCAGHGRRPLWTEGATKIWPFFGVVCLTAKNHGEKKRGHSSLTSVCVYIYICIDIVIYSDIYTYYILCVYMYLYIIYDMCTHTHTHCMHIIYLISIPGPSKEPDICVKFRCVTEFPEFALFRKRTLSRHRNPQIALLWMAGRIPLTKLTEIGMQKVRNKKRTTYAQFHMFLVRVMCARVRTCSVQTP